MNVIEKINDSYGQMSSSQQKIAKFIINNYKQAVFDSSESLSKKAGTSKATVVRFAHYLGYDGFTDMQLHMQSDLLAKSNSQNSEDQNKIEFKNIIENSITKIMQMYSEIDFDEFKIICDEIMSKENILIIGYLDSFGVAAQLLHSLDSIRNNVYFLRLISDWSDIFKIMGENSAVLAVSFAPHYRYTLEGVQMAKAKGSTIITFADNYTNPFNKLSDHMIVFKLDGNEELNIKDTTPVTSFINYIINYLYGKYKEKIDYYIEHEKRYEEYVE